MGFLLRLREYRFGGDPTPSLAVNAEAMPARNAPIVDRMIAAGAIP